MIFSKARSSATFRRTSGFLPPPATDSPDGGCSAEAPLASVRRHGRGGGRSSIAPEKMLRALLLHCLYSVRRERLLMEQIDYNPLLRRFVGLNMDDPIWDCTVFSKNQKRWPEVQGEVSLPARQRHCALPKRAANNEPGRRPVAQNRRPPQSFFLIRPIFHQPVGLQQ